MSVTVKLLGFLVALAAIFGSAVGLGRVVGPVNSSPAADHGDMGDMQMAESGATSIPKGLMVSQNGYSFRLDQAIVAPGAAVPVSFTIEDADGDPVTDYDEEHEKELHLIAVRRDFSGFQHVHPERAEDGTWSTTLDLTAGQWRLFADFKASGAEAITLGNDLAVRGDYQPAAPTADTRTAQVDGYTVTLDGDVASGEEARLTLSVTRDGEPVTDLEPYLGAYGHLVALRSGDLAYLHVHPEGTPGDGKTESGPDVVFFAEVPSPGSYHLYLDFQHDGVVRTAAFTVTASDSAGSEPTSDDESDGEHADDDAH
ncbi:MAG: hypothetical protein ABIR39_22965 [Nocardioides sp.]|uniref:hypothetical protein n=1 Tax=Nocardioides sp. TaxID=35761 RepID=UPI003267F3CF